MPLFFARGDFLKMSTELKMESEQFEDLTSEELLTVSGGCGRRSGSSSRRSRGQQEGVSCEFRQRDSGAEAFSITTTSTKRPDTTITVRVRYSSSLTTT